MCVGGGGGGGAGGGGRYTFIEFFGLALFGTTPR